MTAEIEAQLAAQLHRIEGVHRGFLYQHLFGVGCLLQGGAAGLRLVAVERDEDIELQFEDRQRYIQVKTRAHEIVPADLDGTLKGFRGLWRLHNSGTRTNRPEFCLVTNVRLSRSAENLVAQCGVEVAVQTPATPVADRRMPPAWPSLADAIEWCTRVASTVPFTRLAPETLVWKLASEVAWACSGERPQGHAFEVAGLDTLFEQFVTALQHLPTPPAVYRPQVDEPPLESDRPVRLILALSGGGKTAWAAAHALHVAGDLVYFDSAGVPSSPWWNAVRAFA